MLTLKLKYIRLFLIITIKIKKLMGLAGFEPAAVPLWAVSSTRLN